MQELLLSYLVGRITKSGPILLNWVLEGLDHFDIGCWEWAENIERLS